MANFDIAYKITRHFEGGYNNDPDDVGGETYKGISRKYHPGWKGWELIDEAKTNPDFPKNLESLTDLQTKVKKFFVNFYWNIFWGDQIPDQDIANELFDTSINLGSNRAIKYLQCGLNLLNKNQSLYGDIVEDGVFGNKTLQALKSFLVSDDNTILLKIMNVLQGCHYIGYMTKSPTQEKYARGWFKRVKISKG